jgi:type IV pilus assembly protein PilA
MTATILKPQVRKALLKNLRAKQSSKNKLLQKGFTLVELMIVIVIVGILSAVALPNFLSQTSKAKATEAKTKTSALLKQAAAEALEGTAATALTTMKVAATGPLAVATATGAWTYTMAAGTTDATNDIVATATPTAGRSAVGITPIQGCVDISTGAIQLVQQATALAGC